MQAEKATPASEELAWPDDCPEACEGELEQAVLTPATTAAAMTSPAMRRARGAGRGRGSRARGNGGLRIWISSLIGSDTQGVRPAWLRDGNASCYLAVTGRSTASGHGVTWFAPGTLPEFARVVPQTLVAGPGGGPCECW